MPSLFIRNSPSCHNRRGFTLVEMLVSLMLFSVVVVVALGALLKIINSNKKAQTIQAAISNVSFALDTMSRELRVASTYDCVNGYYITSTPLTETPCSGYSPGNSGIAFYSSKGDTSGNRYIYAYRFIQQSGGDYTLEKSAQTAAADPISNTTYHRVISDEVTLTGYDLKVIKSTNGYPLAFLRLVGYAGTNEQNRTYFDVETAVTPQVP